MKATSLCAALVVVCACKPGAAGRDQRGASASGGGAGARAGAGAPVKAATVNGFQTPESVKWDSAQDVYFVSNINGAPNAKDGNGFISRVGPAGMVTDNVFIKGLNAPTGMALVHDPPWVAAIDVVRAYNARTAAPVATVQTP